MSPTYSINTLEIARTLRPEIRAKSLHAFLRWPPDLFALTSTVLAMTETYRCVVSPPSPGATGDPEIKWPPPSGNLVEYTSSVEQAAAEWRAALNKEGDKTDSLEPLEPRRAARAVPEIVRTLWLKFAAGISSKMREGSVLDLRDAGTHWGPICALVTLHAIADEVFSQFHPLAPQDWLDNFASRLYAECRSLSMIDVSRGRVLPKEHTPQVGLSLRSLSSNLAFHRSPIHIDWFYEPTATGNSPASPNHLNVLILPWPLHVATTDFRQKQIDCVGLPSDCGFFTLRSSLPSRGSPEFKGYVDESLRVATGEVGHVDMVVLPEAALRHVPADTERDELRILEHELRLRDVDYFVAGFCQSSAPNTGFGQNGVAVGVLKDTAGGRVYGRLDPVQYKHHRWMLDREQIRQYQLGSVLSPKRTWIESIEIQERRVRLLPCSGFVLCPLICEDLARQDPVADLVRAVGPSLVLVLLMDGPQFKDRWSAKYASVLAEDPGSAVLTVTSVGMVERWSVPWKKSRRVIALWKGGDGPAVEIELAQDSLGVILSLWIERRSGFTADGRSTGTDVPHLTLAGVLQLPRTASG